MIVCPCWDTLGMYKKFIQFRNDRRVPCHSSHILITLNIFSMLFLINLLPEVALAKLHNENTQKHNAYITFNLFNK